MEREDAIRKLKELEGKDLVALASRYYITVWKGNKKNKGWAVPRQARLDTPGMFGKATKRIRVGQGMFLNGIWGFR